jgi:glutathionylspermidine synthase
MERISTPPRADWRDKVEAIGFDFHTIDAAPYWDERACYSFTAAEIDAIDDAAVELHKMCLAAVDYAVKGNYLGSFGLPPGAAELAAESWRRRDPDVYGRFDLVYDGKGPPKLLEYNADTPTSLFEAAVVQWHWLQDLHPDADQFNSIHEGLVERWGELSQQFPGFTSLHLACAMPHAEDEGTVRYLQATALEAGLSTKVLGMHEIGWNGQDFVDVEGEPIRFLFKLYPWDWLLKEDFGGHIGPSGVAMIEPAWKMLVASKAILSLLSHLYPDSPYLLPATFDPADIPKGAKAVKKPLLGREGSNVEVIEDGRVLLGNDGPYGEEGFIYQAFQPLPDFQNNYPVIGAWMVGDKCRGIGIREDDTPITRNSSRFVPHLFR